MGCAEQATRLELTSVPRPEGGNLASIVAIEHGEQVTVVVPAGRKVYQRTADEGSWKRTLVYWPAGMGETGANLFDGLSQQEASFNFPSDQLFVTRASELWTIATPSFKHKSYLLVSTDAGLTFSEVALPTSLAEVQASPRGDQPAGAASRLRILKSADDRLFITDSRRIWQLEAEDATAIEAESWRRLSIEGIDFDSTARTTQLPAVLRNYLPATEQRPFELLTVLQDQLLVYRRAKGATEWVLTSSLLTVDRHLLEAPGTSTVYLLAPEAVYRSDADGERWDRVQASGHGPQPPYNTSLVALAASEEPAGHILLLGSHDGGIWRSVDGGAAWQEVHLRDPDLRSITGFAINDRLGRIWASTGGSGVLTSRDRGLSWQPDNQGLYATRAFDMARGPNGELLLGTDAGLFRLTGEPRAGHWDRLHARATSALYVHPDNMRIFSGTFGGSIVVLRPDGQQNLSEAAPLGEVDTVLFQPAQLQSSRLPASAIVDIRPRPASQQMFAWSHQQGPLSSNDAGASWRRMKLSEALTTALQGQVITNFATDQDQRLFVVSRSMDHAQPSQLWRSQNNGESWHAIYYFMETDADSPLRVERELHHLPEVLFMVHGSRLAYSLDQGTAWTTLAGPWQKGHIAAFGLFDEQAIVVANMPHASEIFLIERPESNGPLLAHYTLDWPLDQRFRQERVLDVVSHERYIYLSDVDFVFVGTLPRQRTRLPQGIAIFLTIGGLLILTGASFAFLRQR